MVSSDTFARELFEDAKHSLKQAKMTSTDTVKQRHLRHALLAAFGFLELQIELIAQHFRGSAFFTVHEQGVLAQIEVVFDKGNFKLKGTTRYSRLADRMLLLQSKFKGSKLSERSWWEPLIKATDIRNAIAHPRGPVTLKEADVESALLSVLGCANDLFEIVFGKGLPYSSFGIKPKTGA